MLMIVKIGGSVLTNKAGKADAAPSFRWQHARGIARLLARRMRTGKRGGRGEDRFILLIGVGSYGHPPAKKYGVARGLCAGKTVFEQWKGVLVTHAAVLKLLQQVTEVFLAEGIPVCPVSPMDVVLANGSWQTANIGGSALGMSGLYCAVEKILAKGMVPLLHGDVVFDGEHGTKKNGVRILSSDEMAASLAREFSADEVHFLVREGGVKVFPKRAGVGKKIREVLPTVTQSRLQQMLPLVSPATPYTDVTDGFQGKIRAALAYVPPGGTRLYNGSRLRDVEQGLLHGKGGTLITRG